MFSRVRVVRSIVFAAALTLAAGIFAADGADADKDKTSSRPRIRLGGIFIGAGYSHYSYRPWGPWGSYGWPYAYDPYFYGPYIHPGYFTGFGYGPAMGEIKLKSDDRNAWVYVDGGLAGKSEKLKSMWLEPGTYQLEVRSGDKRFSQKIYVLSGKTLRLTADLERQEVRP